LKRRIKEFWPPEVGEEQAEADGVGRGRKGGKKKRNGNIL